MKSYVLMKIIKGASHFNYLGATLANIYDDSKEIKKRIHQARKISDKTGFGMRPHLKVFLSETCCLPNFGAAEYFIPMFNIKNAHDGY